MKMNPDTLLVTTGGTICKGVYGPETLPNGEECHGLDFKFGTPAIFKIFEVGNIPIEQFNHVAVCQKDSLHLTDEDRSQIADTVHDSPLNKVLITHGTDTMKETAEVIKHRCKHRQQVIVLVGSMKPKAFAETDADLKVGIALGVLQSQAKGIYIVLPDGKIAEIHDL